MASLAPRRHAARIACCLLLLACRSDGGTVGMAGAETAEPEPEVILILDLDERSVVQPIDREIGDAEELELIEVEILEIANPERIRILFEVHYHRGGEELLLGTFAPFPPDNPGRFLVPTGGQLRPEGSVELSMVVLDEVGPEDRLRVELEPLTFRKQ